MKPTLTDKEKANQKIKKTLTKLCESVLQNWSFRKINNWGDVYKFIPAGAFSPKPESTLTFQELKSFLKENQDTLEKHFTLTNGSPIPSVSISPQLHPISEKNPYPEHPWMANPHLEDKNTTISTPVNGKPVELPQVVKEQPTDEPVEDLSSKNDYGLIPSPNEKWFPYWFQAKAVVEAIHKIKVDQLKAFLILSATGTGKTFMAGGIVRRLVDEKYHEGRTFGVVNYLYVTRASIVEQTKRVFENTFGLKIRDGIEVLNIEQLRSRAGKMWVNEKTRIVNGDEETYWEWRKGISPCVILWDECQALKNSTSTQSKIAAALSNLEGILQIFISATPFTRVVEAKCFAVSTHKDIGNITGLVGHKLTNENWPTYASQIAGTAKDVEEYNEAAVERLIKDLEPYIIRVKGVRPQFDAVNSIEMIKFETKEERIYYEEAYERYLKEKAKLDALKESGDGETGIQMLVAFLKFRMAAEFCRKNYLAKRMFKTVTEDGKAAVCALNFKGTIIEIVKILVEQYNIPRNQISLIWGGGQTQLNSKQKAKAKIQAQAEKLVAAGMSMDEVLETLDLDEVEDRILQDLPEHLKLGAQSKEERQKEIDRFQSGKAKYCLFTMRAGGVGLSLHHTDEQSPVKVKHQKNGYAVIEDIPRVPILPRRLFAAPTYSAIEIVQALGRCPRLTSLSDTEQFLVFYTGTIEDDVATIVSKKLRCLSKVVKAREKWQDVVMTGRHKVSTHLQDIPDDVKGEIVETLENNEEEE